MKFHISSSDLLSVLSTAAKVINPKCTVPILDHFLFDVNEQTLKITASDLETTMKFDVPIHDVDGTGRFVIPSKITLDVLKECPNMPLEFNVNEETWEVLIRWATGHSSIPGQSAVSYPEQIPLNEEHTEVTLDVDTLIDGINKTIFATSDEELRPIMRGIYFDLKDTELVCVATDAHKLVKYTSKMEEPQNASFILSKKPAALLKNMLLHEEGQIKMAFDQKNALFTTETSTLVCRLIEGMYPNYNMVIPQSNPNRVLVDRQMLLNSVRRMAVCVNVSTQLVRLEFADNSINIMADDDDFQLSAKETVSCSYEGVPVIMGFKANLLVEILVNLDTPTISIDLADSARPGVFKPVSEDEAQQNVLMLLMPMMLNN
ncbi:MAG: DNA polymerase III subunit beta [Alistipes sp.]|nr:DNA polymerase III subunit beta [Candidatus Alistipes equi]